MLLINVTQILISSEHPKVVSVIPNTFSQLHTTHSWEFLGLNSTPGGSTSSLWEQANYGEDVIIANLDTGTIYIYTHTHMTFSTDRNKLSGI